MFSPICADTGMKVRSVFGLNPSAFKNGVILPLISSNRAWSHCTVVSSILLTTKTSLLIPLFLMRTACSRV